SINELRSYLKEKLPDYMLPSAYVFVDSLPLTPSGKVDRRALPVPDYYRQDISDSYVAPRNAIEEVIAGIWAEALKLERVGVEDNFFELGGHSLLATQVISRIRDIFQVVLPLRNIFESPTVTGLTQAILLDESDQVRIEKTAQLLIKLAQLSEEETEAMLLDRKLTFKDSELK
ncbi:MAG: phosphopantetheine-binding protein, partial [Acidobacteriota bacterium]